MVPTDTEFDWNFSGIDHFGNAGQIISKQEKRMRPKKNHTNAACVNARSSFDLFPRFCCIEIVCHAL